VFGVTAMLATQRLQDGFALANFRFDPESKRVVRPTESSIPAEGETASRPQDLCFIAKDGSISRGKPEELAESKDAYLQRFLV